VELEVAWPAAKRQAKVARVVRCPDQSALDVVEAVDEHCVATEVAGEYPSTAW